MAKGYSIRTTGLKELQRKFKKLPDEVASEVDGVLAYSAKEFENRAVQDAPVDQSETRQKISSRREKLLHYETVSAAPQSAYIEFGTRSRVQIPSDLVAYAAQFKGPSGKTGAREAIYAWCKRNGIPKDAWNAIYLKIMAVGINPHPFFFKQRGPVADVMQQKLKPAVKKALSR